MSKLIKTTYEIVTDESAAEGDVAERGWKDEDGEEFESVDDAVEWLRDNGASRTFASSSSFHVGIWYSTEPEQDMYDGSYTTYSFHLEGFTAKEEQQIYEKL